MFAQSMAQLALRARPAAAAGVRRAPLVVSNACPFGFGAPRSAGVAKAAGTATADTTLLARLGGEPALNATLDKFYAALPIDPRVSKFFANTDLNKLKAHQHKFMSMAFTEIPKDYDVAEYMLRGHRKLLKDGLDGTHFDVVAEHLVKALKAVGAPQHLIDEVVGIVAPMRSMFEKNQLDFKAAQAAKAAKATPSA